MVVPAVVAGISTGMRDIITTLSPERYPIVSYTHSTQSDATCQAVSMRAEVAVRLRHASLLLHTRDKIA